MSLFWPGFLYLFLLIPLAIGVYLWVLRRRRRFAVRYSSLSLVREAAATQSWLRQHLPFILFLLVVANEAALSFVESNASGRQLGIVAFAGLADLIQPPTSVVRLLGRAIQSL